MLVSIIITNYNYSKYISRCLRSCFNQTLDKKLYEVIFVDDKSTDNSLKIAEVFKNEKNFKLISNEKNLGVAGSANRGILQSKGRYFVRVDSDDYVSTKFLDYLSTYLINNEDALGVSCDYVLINNYGKKISREKYQLKPVSCGVMYNKDKLISYGLYNEDFRHREEEELRARLGSLYDIHHLNIPLYRYRKHGNNKTTQLDKMQLFKKKLMSTYVAKINDKTKEELLNYVVAVIPARKNSKRLKNKNIHLVQGKPMISWVIEAAKKSKYINDIYVSSDSNKIIQLAKSQKVKTINRPSFLAEDHVFKMDAIVHATSIISKFRTPTIVISLQANSPEIKAKDIDKAVKKLIEFNLNEVISVNNSGNQNGAIRAMKFTTVYQNKLSVHVGTIKTNTVDIHTLEDLKNIKL